MFRVDKLRIDQPRLRPGSWAAHLAVITLVAAATLLRTALGPLFPKLPFITFYPAVILAAFLGGMASGLLAVALAAASAWFVTLPPALSLQVGDHVQTYSLLILGGFK